LTEKGIAMTFRVFRFSAAAVAAAFAAAAATGAQA
jgi:hypothetical protein